MESKKENTKYNCAEIEKKVNAYIDNLLSDKEKTLFEEHLDYCLPCDKKMEFELKLKEFIKFKVREDEYPAKLDEELKSIVKKSDH
jgi:anti-sigma factor (TIGR02949 family)